MKKWIAWLLCVCMACAMFACAKPVETVVEETVVEETVVEETAATEAPVEAAPEATAVPETRIVKGDDGTEVEIDYTITKAAPIIGAFAQMTEMLTNGSGKVVAAATNNISDYFRKVFPDYEQSNPNNYNSMAVEDLVAAGAQVCYGPAGIFKEDQVAQLKAAGCAFVPISKIGTVEGMCNAFLIIGEILGPDEYARAEKFVAYYQGNIDLCKEKTAGIADADKITCLSLFYTDGAYTTTNAKDISNEYMEAAGGVNVAAQYSMDAGGNGLAVDAEQIVAWNPKFIMASNQAGKEAILADAALQTVEAVKNGNVGVCPYGVYLWSVRSGEGSMLPLWLGTQMYPELFSDIDMSGVVKAFFSDWYSYTMTDDEIANALAGSSATGMTR